MVSAGDAFTDIPDVHALKPCMDLMRFFGAETRAPRPDMSCRETMMSRGPGVTVNMDDEEARHRLEQVFDANRRGILG